MFEGDTPTWIAVVVANVYLLQNATKDLPVSRWLSPFSLGWIVAGLMFFHPLVMRGSWMAMGAAYLLMGVLIVNTLVLSTASKMPERVVSFKSEGLEKVGLIFTGFLLAGVAVLVKNGFASLKQLINARLQRQDGILATWSNV
jgi:hypothetical protein